MTVSLNRLDLNLLRVFDAIMEERSVLRAGQKASLSQSAVSHSLSRLREMLDDELFIRTSTGMQPTSRALAMAPLIRDALKSLEAAIEPEKFEPATSTKRFTIATSDFASEVVVPHALQILTAEAPHVDIVIRPVTRTDLAEQMDLGRIDVAIGSFFSALPQRFKSSLLFEYDEVLVTNSSQKHHTITTEMLSDASTVLVSFGDEQDGAVDDFISERGLGRRSEIYDRKALERDLSMVEKVPRIAVSLPHFMALPALLDGSALAAVVPRPLAKSFAHTHPISIYELPCATTHLEVHSLWHERHEGDASQDWLHGVLRRATARLRANPVEQATLVPTAVSRPSVKQTLNGKL